MRMRKVKSTNIPTGMSTVVDNRGCVVSIKWDNETMVNQHKEATQNARATYDQRHLLFAE